jgi:hypothetical protein
MDRFDQLVAEFVPADATQFDRDLVLKLMELAFRLGQNCGLSTIASVAVDKKNGG